MTKSTLTVIFFALLLLVFITGGLYLFLEIDAPQAEPSADLSKKSIAEADDSGIEPAAETQVLKIKADIQLDSLQDFQNAVDFMEDNNIVRDKFLFLRCPDCASDFAIQDCIDLLQDAKQDPEVLYMADSIGLDLNNVHRVHKKHENKGIFCYYYI